MPQKTKTIAAVFAHPDDESFTTAGSIAKYRQSGAEIILITATLGQQGSKRNIKKNEDLAKVREHELESCCKLLKIKQLHLLGYQDGHLRHVDKKELESKIENILVEHKPNIVITFGPEGITGHVDHVAISKATTDVFKKVCDSGKCRLLYVAPLDRHIKNKSTGLPSRLSATLAKTMVLHQDHEVDVVVDIANFWQMKMEALRCHFSQDDVRGFYNDFEKEALGEECFILAAGKNFSKKPVNDIFENL